MNIFEIKKKKIAFMRNLRRNSAVKIKSDDAADKIFITCPECKAIRTKSDLINNFYICPACGHHFKLGAYDRIDMLADENSFQELNSKMTSNDVLKFPNYRHEIRNAMHESGLNEAYVYGECEIDSMPAVIGVLDSRFIMGSMGSTVGEKVTLSIEYAMRHRLPIIIFSASGGARMHEGTVSLMQMAKTSAALHKYSAKGGLYISYLTHPTTGGVTASFASLGDIMLAEPKALIGFAGPRVIEQTIGSKLPDGFQSSEFLLEHGFIDKIVTRDNMKSTISQLLRLHERRRK